MCFLGLLGIILMIIENEMTFMNINHKQTTLSLLLKIIMSITTVILVCLIVYYNCLNLNLYAVNNTLDSWRVGLTRKKTFFILLEIVICLIHPIPRYFPLISTQTYSKSLSYIEIDVALSLPSEYNFLFLHTENKIRIHF
jgi:potassium intermediate/small conductance calcium-activated channel subfamily N protein 2